MKPAIRIKLFTLAAIGAVWLLPAASAPAAFKLTIDDQSGADVAVNGSGGALNYYGSVGSFNVVWTTAMSKPVVGAPDTGELYMTTVLVSGGSGVLQFKLTDTGFQLPGQSETGILMSDVLGQTAGQVDFQSWIDFEDREFGQGLTTGLQGSFGSGKFDDTQRLGFVFPDTSPFSLSQVVNVSHDTGLAQQTTFTFMTTAHAPEPASLIIWSLLGLAAVVLVRRRRV